MDDSPRKKRRLVKIYRRPLARQYSLPETTTSNAFGLTRVNSALPRSYVNEDLIKQDVEPLSHSSILFASNELQSQVIPKKIAVKRLSRVKHDDGISNSYIQQNSKVSFISDKSQSEVFDSLQQSTSSVELVPTKITRYSIPNVTRIHSHKKVKPTYDYDVIESSVVPNTSSQTSGHSQRTVKVIRSTSARPPYRRRIRRKILFVRKTAENTDDEYSDGGWFSEYCPCWSQCCCLIATLLLSLLLLAGLITLLALLLTSKSKTTTTITTTILTDTTISATGCNEGSGSE